MELDKTEILVGALGAAGAYGVAEAFSRNATAVYEPLVSLAKNYLEGTTFEFKAGYFGTELTVASKQMSLDVGQVLKVLQVSQRIAISSAFWVAAIETGVNFFRAWKGKGERPFVVDILEGGIRGSIVGLVVSVVQRQSEYRGIQITTGIAIGYTLGMASAFIGSLGGCIAHYLQNPPIQAIDNHLRDLHEYKN